MSIHVVAGISTLFLFYCWIIFIVWIYNILFIHSSIGISLGCFHFLAYMSNSAMNTCVQVFTWTYIFIFLDYVSWSRVAGSYNFIFNLLRNCHTILQGNWIILNSHQQWISIPTSTYPYRYLSFWSQPSLWVWNGISWWFWLAFPWRLMILSLFSYACWPFIYLPCRSFFLCQSLKLGYLSFYDRVVRVLYMF